MTGTIVNSIVIVIGGFIGILIKKGVGKNIENALYKSLGIAIIVIGLNGVITNMFSVGQAGELSSRNELLLVISLALGTIVGEMLHLDIIIEKFSSKIENKFKVNGFTQGFISASTIFCVGAMAIIGALNDGISGNSSVLFTKSLLDFTTSVILGSTLGIGVVFSAVPVFVYQGLISIFAHYLSGYLQGEILSQICMIGYCIVAVIGINFIFPNKFKTINLLPAILVPVFYDLILKIISIF